MTLIKEVRANASSVHSDLGGGKDSYFGLDCKPEVYATLAPEAAPYIRPENPGRLQLKDRITQYQIVQCRDKRLEATGVFLRNSMSR